MTPSPRLFLFLIWHHLLVLQYNIDACNDAWYGKILPHMKRPSCRYFPTNSGQLTGI
jgi:hypothetical protein